MAGEKDVRQIGRRVQPGGRAPAPAQLAVAQAFINTHYDLEVEHGADLLATPGALAGWLTAQGLVESGARAGREDLQRALAMREGLRALARANCDRRVDGAALDRLNGAAAGATIEIRLTDAGPRFVRSGQAGVAGALGVLLAITARAMIDGSWYRLKVCPGEDCGWVFYDHSRNQAGRWCSMSVCGGRAKARAHYRRRRGGGG